MRTKPKLTERERAIVNTLEVLAEYREMFPVSFTLERFMVNRCIGRVRSKILPRKAAYDYSIRRDQEISDKHDEE